MVFKCPILFGRKLFLYSLLFFILIFCGCQNPPTIALQNAKNALESAADAGALRYSEPLYRQAEETLTDGWMEMARQQGRLAPFQNYRIADSLLNQAYALANQAAQQTRDIILEQSLRAQAEQENLLTELRNWREGLDGSLYYYKAEQYWFAADLGARTSERLILSSEYEEAIATIAKSRVSLRKLGSVLAEYANDEKHRRAQARVWVQETLTESRAEGNYAVIVDKYAHKTYLVHGGNLEHTYDCEVGYNSARQKLFSGDGATPEGKYRIVEVRTRGSKYYKALLLDYPNQTDYERFKRNKSKGIISKYARIGKFIEIHGEGGKDRDWTEGCVALENRHMDHLIKFVSEGTPVTIVSRSDQFP